MGCNRMTLHSEPRFAGLMAGGDGITNGLPTEYGIRSKAWMSSEWETRWASNLIN